MRWGSRFLAINFSLSHPFRVHRRARSTLSLRRLEACVSFLQACALRKVLRKGKETHCWMVVHGFQTSPLSITSLINFYCKCACPSDALSVFLGSENLSPFAWNAMISGMVVNGFPKDALSMYQDMRNEGVSAPDMFTYPPVINACSDLGKTDEIRKIHCNLFKVGLEMDLYACSALVTSYIKSNHMEDAGKLFEELPERDVVLWNSMVNGFAQMGMFRDASEFFRRMMEEGIFPSKFTITGIVSVFAAVGAILDGRKVHALVVKCGYESDVIVSNSLVDMYGKIGDLGEAVRIFEGMSGRDIFSWNSMLSVLQQAGDHMEALRLLHRMMGDRIPPDSITITAALPSCAQTCALMHGQAIHGYMVVNGMRREGGIIIENAIMDMYAKCGSLGDAQVMFDRMQRHDVASWNILIGGYASYGLGLKALQLFSSMCESRVAPDDVTFVEVLSACSHAGFVERGMEILELMEKKHGVAPTVHHYSCVVDMLSRAGKLAEAHDLLVRMPAGLSNPVVWRAFIASCRTHGNMDLAIDAANHLLEMDPEHCGSYVLLSNVFGSVGKYEEVSEVRLSMRSRNVRKMPGCSWIELSSGMHAFITGDRNHEESEEIYSMVHVLVTCLQDFGYVPDVHQGE